ncbi:PMS1 protein homolog 1-like isoform X3 [Oscarella lobularis]|uniref:PMS1 protein homolog 1-like isoform X3 n=1 Tax=Oscarella lobularis TaxID=121494 RepID=UPI00331363F3
MNKLPDATARLLSCSQIITSVSSVVKELLENSIDADATSIEVRLDDYGLDRIEVRDNGRGITPALAELAARQSYTSKLSSISDLATVTTYGFRGEALSALCAISDVTMTSSTEEAVAATTVVYDSSGAVVASKPASRGRGTTVTARRLFKNVPVRKQAYATAKKRNDELLRIRDLLAGYALVLPRLRLELRNNKMTVWQKSGVATRREAFAVVFGSDVANSMTEIDFALGDDLGGLRVAGLLPESSGRRREEMRGKLSTGNASQCVACVNGRPVEFKALKKLLSKIILGESSSTRYPLGVLCLDFAVPGSVDVNVEPNKTRVMIRRCDDVLAAVKDELEKIFANKEIVQSDDDLTDDAFASLRIPDGDESGRRTNDVSPPPPPSWTRGNSVRDDADRPVEPVRVLVNEPQSRQRSDSPRDARPPPKKKHKEQAPSSTQSVSKSKLISPSKPAFCSSQRPARTPSLYSLLQKRSNQMSAAIMTKRLQFSLEEVKRRLSMPDCIANRSTYDSDEEIEIVGWLDRKSLCIVKHREKLLCFDTVKAREAMVFNRLNDSFILPHDRLDDPYPLDADQLGGEDNWKRLLSLEWARDSWSGSRECVDPLVSANGFLVKQVGTQNVYGNS